MLEKIEVDLATAGPAEKLPLRRRADLICEVLAPRPISYRLRRYSIPRALLLNLATRGVGRGWQTRNCSPPEFFYLTRARRSSIA